MINMRVKVKWIPKSLENRPEWDKAAMKRVLPLIQIARMLAAEVRARVVSESRDAAGNKFGAYAGAKTEAYVFWVPTTLPQPQGGRLTHVAVTKSGMVAYGSSLEYHKQLTGASYKNFTLTGKMWRSLRVRAMSPSRVIVSFYGSSQGWFKKGPKGRKTRNADKAYYAAKRETLGILWISDAEAERVYKFLEEVYASKLSVLLREDGAKFLVERTAGKISRRIKRADRKLSRVKKALGK